MGLKELADTVRSKFNGKQRVKGWTETAEPNIRDFVTRERPSLAGLARELGVSTSSAQKIAKTIFGNDYDRLFGDNIHRSQEFRTDLPLVTERPEKQKPARQQILPRMRAISTPAPKEKTQLMQKSENPKFAWLEVNLYGSHWRNERGLPDLDRLAIHLRVPKSTVESWKKTIDARDKRRQKVGQ